MSEIAGVAAGREVAEQLTLAWAEREGPDEHVEAFAGRAVLDGDRDVAVPLEFVVADARGAHRHPDSVGEMRSCAWWVIIHAGFHGQQLGRHVVRAGRNR